MTANRAQVPAAAATKARRRAIRALPERPAYDYAVPVDIFTAEDAEPLFAAARPKRAKESDPERLAMRLNGIITDVAGWARHAGSAPKPSDLQAALTGFRNNCHDLLTRMDLDASGEPKPAIPVLTTPMQPWYQWLKSGLYGLMNDAAEAQEATPNTVSPAELDLARTAMLATAIVDPAIGHRAAADTAKMRAELGQDFPEKSRIMVYRVAMASAAIERAGPMLALLAMLAEAAAARPLDDPPKANFQRSYIDDLFIGLADVWFETFGTRPSGVGGDRAPGGPAFRWFRTVLEHAHDMSGRLPDDVQTALAAAQAFCDRTVADRIKAAVRRSRVILRAQGSNRDSSPR